MELRVRVGLAFYFTQSLTYYVAVVAAAAVVGRMSSDFMFSDPSGMVSFAASGDNIMMITILILDDDIFEDTEDFNVSLTLAVSSIVNGSAILENDTIQVFIADNDSKSILYITFIGFAWMTDTE